MNETTVLEAFFDTAADDGTKADVEEIFFDFETVQD